MQAMHPNDEEKLSFGRHVMQRKARDHARTPVQWSAGPNAGFCKADVEPWMRVIDDYKTVNAEAQREQKPDQLSVLQFWKRGIANRKEHKDVFIYGSFDLVDEENTKIFAYKRSSGTKAFMTVLNFSRKDVQWKVPEEAKLKSWVAGNYTAGKPEQATSGTITVKAWEGLLGELMLAKVRFVNIRQADITFCRHY